MEVDTGISAGKVEDTKKEETQKLVSSNVDGDDGLVFYIPSNII